MTFVYIIQFFCLLFVLSMVFEPVERRYWNNRKKRLEEKRLRELRAWNADVVTKGVEARK